MAGRTCREVVARVPSMRAVLTEEELEELSWAVVIPLAEAVIEGDVEALGWLMQMFDGKGLAQESERLAAERATSELEAVASELERSQARAGAELAAARSAARASAAGEAAATARVDSLAMDVESAQRRAREDAEEMERRLADAAEAERDAMSEAEALRETNKELTSFMAELEHASAEASAEGEAMAAQMEQMRAELANAGKAAAVAAVPAGGEETPGDSAVAGEPAAEAERAQLEKVAARATRGRAAGDAAAKE